MDQKQNFENWKLLKLIVENKLLRKWTVKKAVAQMDKVSKHSCSAKEAMRTPGVKQKGDLI